MSRKTIVGKPKIIFLLLIIVCLVLAVAVLFIPFVKDLRLIDFAIKLNIFSTIFLAGLLITASFYFLKKVMAMENISMSGEMNEIANSIRNFGQQYESEIQAIKNSQEEIKKKIQNVVRQDYKLTNEFQTNTEEAKRLNKQLSETQELINESLKMQLEEINVQSKELMQQRQDNGILQGEIKKWQEFAVNFFDNLERILELQDDTSNQIVEKVIKDFDKYVNPLGLERVAPSSGDDLNEELHQADEEKESSDVEPGKVLECKKWGYKINGKLYQDKRAEVSVAKALDQLPQEDDQKEESNPEVFTDTEQTETASVNQPVETSSEDSKENIDNQIESSDSETDENSNNTSDSN